MRTCSSQERDSKAGVVGCACHLSIGRGQKQADPWGLLAILEASIHGAPMNKRSKLENVLEKVGTEVRGLQSRLEIHQGGVNYKRGHERQCRDRRDVA